MVKKKKKLEPLPGFAKDIPLKDIVSGVAAYLRTLECSEYDVILACNCIIYEIVGRGRMEKGLETSETTMHEELHAVVCDFFKSVGMNLGDGLTLNHHTETKGSA